MTKFIELWDLSRNAPIFVDADSVISFRESTGSQGSCLTLRPSGSLWVQETVAEIREKMGLLNPRED